MLGQAVCYLGHSECSSVKTGRIYGEDASDTVASMWKGVWDKQMGSEQLRKGCIVDVTFNLQGGAVDRRFLDSRTMSSLKKRASGCAIRSSRQDLHVIHNRNMHTFRAEKKARALISSRGVSACNSPLFFFFSSKLLALGDRRKRLARW